MNLESKTWDIAASANHKSIWNYSTIAKIGLSALGALYLGLISLACNNAQGMPQGISPSQAYPTTPYNSPYHSPNGDSGNSKPIVPVEEPYNTPNKEQNSVADNNANAEEKSSPVEEKPVAREESKKQTSDNADNSFSKQTLSLAVTDGNTGSSGLNEFRFGSDVFVKYRFGITPPYVNLTLIYSAPNGVKYNILDGFKFSPNSPSDNYSANLNFIEMVGTLEPGQHSLEAMLKTSSGNNVTESVSFKVQEPVNIRADGTLIEKPVYTQREWDYFKEIAFGVEYVGYGNNGKTTVKWSKQNPLRIIVRGSVSDESIRPSQESMDVLTKVVEELKGLTSLDIRFTDDPSKANFNVFLDIPHSDFYPIFPNFDKKIIDANDGLFHFDFNEGYYIRRAVVAISKDPRGDGILPRNAVNKLITEEVAQALGLGNDSDAYWRSIFRQSNNFENLYLLPIDRRVIRLLYEPAVRPGMSINQVRELIEIIK